MPAKNEDWHGNVPDEAPVALLIIDMINDFEFPGGEPSLPPLCRLQSRSSASNVGLNKPECP